MNTTVRWRSIAACAVALALVMGACGDDKGVGNVRDGGQDGIAPGDGGFGDADDGGVDVQLVSITITPANPVIAIGISPSLTATAVYSDNSTRNITNEATWASSQAAVATVSNVAGSQGLVTALAAGVTDVTASLAGMVGATTVTVSAAVLESITVEPSMPAVPAGLSQSFTAAGHYSDGLVHDLTGQATWSSSDVAVATISSARLDAGTAKALAVGSTTVSAAFGDKMGSTLMAVTAATLTRILITPSQAAIAAGTSVQYLATGVFSDDSTKDLTEQATWSTSDVTKATISNTDGSRGSALGKAAGDVTITASLGGVMGTTNLAITDAVLEAIAIEPSAPKVVKGTTLQFSANGSYSDGSTQDLTDQVTWTSGAPTIATISNAVGSRGLAAGQSVGDAVITASLGGLSANTTLTVTQAALVSVVIDPASVMMARSAQVPLRAIATFADATTQDVTMQAAWSSSNATIVSVSNASQTRGVVTSHAAGVAMVSATVLGSVVSANITVTDATLTTITVTPAAASVAAGSEINFVATATFSDGSTQNVTDQATWSSASHAVAVISNSPTHRGVATAKGAGTTNISALLGGVTGSTSLTVVQATLQSIAVTPANSTAAPGAVVVFKAIATYSDNSTQDITSQVKWSSSSKRVASISNARGQEGNAKALAAGMTTVEAKLRATKGSTMLTVAQP